MPPDGRPYSFGQIKDNGKRVQDGGSLDAPQLGSVEPEPLNFRVFLTAPLWSWSGVNLRRGGYDS